MIMEVCLHGTFVRKAGDPVKAVAMGSGISASEVSRICISSGTEAAAFRDRSLAGQPFRYVVPGATCCKARVDHQVVSRAAVVATGVKGHVRRARRCPADLLRASRAAGDLAPG
jgi:putative transposase